jgi:hypothetical protein
MNTEVFLSLPLMLVSQLNSAKHITYHTHTNLVGFILRLDKVGRGNCDHASAGCSTIGNNGRNGLDETKSTGCQTGTGGKQPAGPRSSKGGGAEHTDRFAL